MTAARVRPAIDEPSPSLEVPLEERLRKAAEWLVTTPLEHRGGATVPALERLFGLNQAQAVEAIRRKNSYLDRAARAL